MRLIRYASCTLFGCWVWIIAAVLDITLMCSRFNTLLGDTQLVVRFMACDIFSIAILGAAVAALDSARLMHSPELIFTVRRTYSGFTRAWLCTWIPLIVERTFVLISALTVAHAWNYRYNPCTLVVAFAVQCLLIGWALACGSCIGRCSRARFAPFIAIVVMIVLTAVLSNSASSEECFQPLGDSGASVIQIGITFAWWPLLVQIVLLGLGIAAMLLCRICWLKRVFVPTISSACYIAGSLILMLGAMFLLPTQRFDAHAESPDVCTEGAVTICVYHEHVEVLHNEIEYIQHFTQTLQDAGYDFALPDRIEEVSRRYTPTHSEDMWIVGFPELTLKDDDQQNAYVVANALASSPWCDSDNIDAPFDTARWEKESQLIAQYMYIASGQSLNEFRENNLSLNFGNFQPMTVDETREMLRNVQACTA